MNFNLKKYLVLSMAGLTICTMSSNAMDFGDYARQYRYNPADNKGLTPAKKIWTEMPSKLELWDANKNIQQLVKTNHLFSDKLFSDLVAQVFQPQFNAITQFFKLDPNAKYSLPNLSNKVLQHSNYLFNTRFQNFISINQSSKYIVSEKARNLVVRIFSLMELIRSIRTHNNMANANNAMQQIQLNVITTNNNRNGLFYLWNMLLSITDYDQFCDSLVSKYSQFMTDSEKNMSMRDAGIGAIIEEIVNNQTFYQGEKNVSGVAQLLYESIFNSVNNQSMFDVLQNNKIDCKLSTFGETFNEKVVSQNTKLQFGTNNFDFNTTNDMLNKIGVNAKLTEAEMYMVDLLLRNVKLPQQIKRTGFQTINNVGDLAIYLNYVMNNPDSQLVNNGHDQIIDPKNNTNLPIGNQGQQPNINLLKSLVEQKDQEIEELNQKIKALQDSGGKKETKDPNSEKPDPLVGNKNDNNEDAIFVPILSKELSDKYGLKIKAINLYKEKPEGVDCVIDNANQQLETRKFSDLVTQKGRIVFDITEINRGIDRSRIPAFGGKEGLYKIRQLLEKDVGLIKKFYTNDVSQKCNYLEFVIA